MKRGLICISLIFTLLGVNYATAQDSLAVEVDSVKTENVPITRLKIDGSYEPLSPSKAAFYSAVLPGLGQAYNHSYWKIPLVYGGLGAGVYFYKRNNDKFHEYREAYKRRLAGYEDDQFQGRISDEGLIQAQKVFRRNKEVSIFFTIAWYALNIVDANVEAHLKQFNVDDNLSIKPDYNFDNVMQQSSYGLSLNYKF